MARRSGRAVRPRTERRTGGSTAMTEVLGYAQDDMVPMIFVLVASLCSRAAQAQSTAAIAFVASTVMLAQRRDTAALRRMSDEHFVFVHSTGRAQKREEFLACVVQGRQDSIRVLDSPEEHDAGATGYVVTHTASWAPVRGWTPFSSTDVVVRSSAGLRWLGHQSTALPATATFIAIYQSVKTTDTGRYVSAQGLVRD